MRIVDCPGCALPAEVKDDWYAESTNGPIRCVRTFCVNRHNYTTTVEVVTWPRTH